MGRQGRGPICVAPGATWCDACEIQSREMRSREIESPASIHRQCKVTQTADPSHSREPMTCRVTCGRMAGNRTRACMTYAWRGGDGGVAARRRSCAGPRDFSGGAPESRPALALRETRMRIESANRERYTRVPAERANRERKPRPRIEAGRITRPGWGRVCSGRGFSR